MNRYIISLDQGTTSSRAVIFDDHAQMRELVQKEFKQIYPQPGWVEHDPMEIYASQYAVLMEAVAKSGISGQEIAAIGITNQRETAIVWDRRTGKPVYNAIVWQCRRTADIVEQIHVDGLSDYIRENTGLIPDAYFSATKIKWILDHVDGARELAEQGHLLCGTVDTWLIWKLTEGRVFATDYTNASRTMLYNIRTLQWDSRLCDYFGIPASMLPEVKASSADYGTVSILGRDVPICGVAGDQQAALFGQACFGEGDVKNTYGTGCFLLMNTGSRFITSQNGLLTTIAASAGGPVQYALEGSVFVGGALIQWLRDEMRLISDAADTEYFAQKAGTNNGVYIVPAFTGLGAPYWDMYARGSILGLTRGADRNHIIRAALEAIAYQTMDVMGAMEQDTGLAIRRLKVDGGASNNNFLMQFQADIIGATVQRARVMETTALGAAYLAGLYAGVWRSTEEIARSWSVGQEYTPAMEQAEKEHLASRWHKAVQMCAGWAKD
ncbi:MAG: glycerol kinase GlpK [Oscillospiraceae bacterium]|nr:glycerol kinase GlpK [Oscillospiraceae bacterium]